MLRSVTKLKTSEPDDDQRDAGIPPRTIRHRPPPASRQGRSTVTGRPTPTGDRPAGRRRPSVQRGSGFRRTALALFAIACVGAGGGTAWALTTASISTRTPNGSQPPAAPPAPVGQPSIPNNGGNVPSTGARLSAATIAKLDSAIVDINADVAGGSGQVAGTGMIITSNGEVLTNNHVIDQHHEHHGADRRHRHDVPGQGDRLRRQ